MLPLSGGSASLEPRHAPQRHPACDDGGSYSYYAAMAN